VEDGLLDAKVRVWDWGQYFGRGDWLHDVVYSSAARINDLSKVPQPLFNMTSDVDPGSVKYSDWMAGTTDVRGYGIVIKKSDDSSLQLLVDLKFKLIDFKVWFPKSKTNYGYSNIFTPDLNPKSIVDAFWYGIGEDGVTSKLDTLLSGFLDNDKPMKM
jgi:hypothetical protein